MLLEIRNEIRTQRTFNNFFVVYKIIIVLETKINQLICCPIRNATNCIATLKQYK